jgi:hypothetical protein
MAPVFEQALERLRNGGQLEGFRGFADNLLIAIDVIDCAFIQLLIACFIYFPHRLAA